MSIDSFSAIGTIAPVKSAQPFGSGGSLLQMKAAVALDSPPDRRDVVVRGPGIEIAAMDGGGHEIGEQIRRARERGDAERGEGAGVALIVGRRAAIADRE